MLASAAVQRWDAFLSQVELRHASVLDEAARGMRAAMETCGHDLVPMTHAWTAVELRLVDLEHRVLTTWSEQVAGALESEGTDGEERARALHRGEDLVFELEGRRDIARSRAFAEGALELHRRAIAAEARSACDHCGAPLPVAVAFRAVNLQCRSCRSVSTIEPGTVARNALALGAHEIANRQSEAERLALRRAEQSFRRSPEPVPLAILKALESAHLAFARRYCSALATLDPSQGKTEVEARMDSFWTRMEAEASWRAAGRPRALLGATR